MGNSRRAKSSTAVARESIQTLFIYARRLLSGCPRAHGLALPSMDIHPRTAVVMVSNPKIGRSRVILGYFSFFGGYFRLNSIFRNAKRSQMSSSKRQYMVEAVGKAEK